MPRSARISTSSRSCSVSSSSLRLVKTPAMLPVSSRDERASPSLMRWNQERLGAGSGAFSGSAFCSTFLVTVTLPGAGFGADRGVGDGCGSDCGSGAIRRGLAVLPPAMAGGWAPGTRPMVSPQLKLGQHRQVRAAPHPYPLPVRDGERGRQRWSFFLLPVTIRGEGAGRRMRGGAEFWQISAGTSTAVLAPRQATVPVAFQADAGMISGCAGSARESPAALVRAPAPAQQARPGSPPAPAARQALGLGRLRLLGRRRLWLDVRLGRNGRNRFGLGSSTGAGCGAGAAAGPIEGVGAMRRKLVACQKLRDGCRRRLQRLQRFPFDRRQRAVSSIRSSTTSFLPNENIFLRNPPCFAVSGGAGGKRCRGQSCAVMAGDVSLDDLARRACGERGQREAFGAARPLRSTRIDWRVPTSDVRWRR